MDFDFNEFLGMAEDDVIDMLKDVDVDEDSVRHMINSAMIMLVKLHTAVANDDKDDVVAIIIAVSSLLGMIAPALGISIADAMNREEIDKRVDGLLEGIM